MLAEGINGSLVWCSIKNPINEYMQQIRKIRLHDIYMQTLKIRVSSLESLIKDIISWRNVTCWECEVRIPELFELVDPEKEELEFNTLRSTLKSLIKDYLEKREDIARQELSSAVRRIARLDESVDPFSLAMGSFFRCAGCDLVFKPQEAIRHVCGERYSRPRVKPDWMPDAYFDAILKLLPPCIEQRRLIWNVGDFLGSLSQAARAIKACGFDFRTATLEDLDNVKDLRLVCLKHMDCDENRQYVPVMTWRTAVCYFVYHSVTSHAKGLFITQAFYGTLCCHDPGRHTSAPTFERATEEEVLAVQECEARIKEAAILDYEREYREYYCSRCHDPPPRDRYVAICHMEEA